MKKLIVFVLLLVSISWLSAQSITNINAGLVGLMWGSAAWGDYDGDGDLDVIITGTDAAMGVQTKIYRNDGNDTFVEIANQPIPGTNVGDVVWGDYDGDGDLDILIEGFLADVTEFTHLYRNDGNDIFTDSGVNLIQVADGSVNFVDYNNDGALDLLVSGFDDTDYKTILYRNNGDGTFTTVTPGLPGTIKSAFEWADYDKDGDLDVFLTGYDFNGNLLAQLYQNNGEGGFVLTANAFTGVWLGDANWGDFNNDGFTDLLLSGFTEAVSRICTIYPNNGDGTFGALTNTGLIGVSHSSTIWGDFDNDGDLDVFIGGTYESGSNWVRVTDVFINNGDSTFTAANLNFTTDAFWGESAWGDYDADGDLDLLCNGSDDAGLPHTNIYRNESTVANTPPAPPQGLQAQVSGDTVWLSWHPASDAETPAAGLSYNIYIRNSAGQFVVSPMADVNTGWRYLPALGNAQQDTFWMIKNLPDGVYTWSVQAIDHGFMGSAFAQPDTFTVGAVAIHRGNVARDYHLVYNYPNPFNATTNIEFQLQQSGEVELDIYNARGQKVASPVRAYLTAGKHRITWQAQDKQGRELASGIYIYRLKTPTQQYLGKMILMK